MYAEENQSKQEATSRTNGQPQWPADLIGCDHIVSVQVLGQHDHPDDNSDAVWKEKEFSQRHAKLMRDDKSSKIWFENQKKKFTN